ncbi:MAG: hypothetical protein K1X75_10985 [Leptospirales bacterium]|nr:hypothetical protein [Leptospirales bacterium]
MRLRIFQHVPFESAAMIGDWAEARGVEVLVTRLFAGERPPGHADADLLAVMGGPMGVYDEGRHPWLIMEKMALQQWLDAKRGILGVCLGAQLLAEALGARVEKNREAEIGWRPVIFSDRARQHPAFGHFPYNPMVLHWHGDVFSLPPGALHLASTDLTPNQAFLQGRALGLQFHLEMDQDAVERIIAACAEDLRPGPFVQSVQQLQSGVQAYAESCRTLLYPVLDWLAAGA